MSRWWVVACFFAACVNDSYRCEVDTDCNLGDGGRCEADHYCTHLDSSCLLTQRSYTAHSDALSGTCFVGEAEQLNYCAAGQPPATPTGCAAKVCAAQPVCCTTGWSEACVLEAQHQCFPELKCDTRISVAATHNGVVEIFDLGWDGTQWVFRAAHPELGNTATYLAPAPGTNEPRLAGFSADGGSVLIESSTANKLVPIDGSLTYRDLASLDLDRDLRDTLLLDYSNTDESTRIVQVVKLDTGESRNIDTGVSTRMAWGATADDSGFVDGYPDGVAGNAATYKVLENTESDQSKYRNLVPVPTAANTFDSFPTAAGGGQVHSFVWADVDGDGLFDLIAFGNSLRIHTKTITETAFLDLDCNPPKPYEDCFASGGSDGSGAVAMTAYNGAVLPGPGAPRILAAPVDGVYKPATHSIYSILLHADQSYEYDTLTPPPNPNIPPTCTNECPFESIVVRDLDGDGRPDILAIDNGLSFYTALSGVDSTLHTFAVTQPLKGHALTNLNYNQVRTTATGVPR